jgi:diguanylate cyclase
MPLHLPTLLFAGTVFMTLAAVLTSLFGLTQRVYRGYRFWAAAQWVASAALALQWIGQGTPALLPITQVMLVQWPLITLLGVRRFHARQPLPGSASIDVAALGVAALACVGVPLFGSATAQTVVGGLACGAATAYAAAVLLMAPREGEGGALRLLGTALFATAAVMLFSTLRALDFGPENPATATGDLQPVAILAVTLLAALMAYLALLLTHQRTERQLRESHRRLRFFANMDLLTQVPNRRHFGELARRALRSEEQRSAALLMFDIDHFKRINDDFGHAAGDQALKLVSQCVQGTLRAQDVVGRHGGDEFVLLLPGTSMRDAMAVATRMVARAQTLALAQEMRQISLSFGVVELRAHESLDEAIGRADQALFEAKRQGRGRAVSASVDKERAVFVESRRIGLAPL